MTRAITFLVALLISSSALASAPSRRVIADLRAANTLEAQAEKTVSALNILFRAACLQARAIGKADEADAVCSDWQQFWMPTLTEAAKSGRGLGDHEPLSQWLAAATVVLYAVFADYPVLADMLRLEDLVVFNYGIPVFMEPHAAAAWCVELPDVPCRDEYQEHAQRVISSSSYWLAWGGCVGATWGLGIVGFACTPVGSLTETIVLATVAPRLSLRIWDRNND